MPKTIPYDLVAATYNQIAKAAGAHAARVHRRACQTCGGSAGRDGRGEKLERVRKAFMDDIVNKGERAELMADFDAFETAVKAEAAVKEFPKKYRQKLRNNWTQLERRRAKNVQKKDGK